MHTMKVVIGGASGVGTTTYLHRLVHDEFLDDTTSTVGISFLTKVVQRGDRAVTLMLWDLSGQERYRFFQPSYVQGATAGIVLFDLCRIWSLFQVQEWVVMFRSMPRRRCPSSSGGQSGIAYPTPNSHRFGIKPWRRSPISASCASCRRPRRMGRTSMS